MTTRFDTVHQFKNDATGYTGTDTRAARTMGVRLNDVVNVKDWGARGDGSHDDTAALAAAIAFANNRTVYLPPGTYRVDTPPLAVAGTIIGAGRDVSIIRGSYTTGTKTPYFGADLVTYNNPSYLCQDFNTGGGIDLIADLTIYNESTDPGSGAFFGFGNTINYAFRNVHFVGTMGCRLDCEQFGTGLYNCVATNIVPITGANMALASRSPAVHSGEIDPYQYASTGFWLNQGNFINCRSEGFAYGFISNFTSPCVIGCRAYRCETGFLVGRNSDHSHDGSGSLIMAANVAERCIAGLVFQSCGGAVVAGNVFSAGTVGPYDDAQVTNMSHTAGVVTVTTSLAHNLSTTNRIRLDVGSGWTSDPNKYVTVTATPTTTTFQFSGSAGSGTTGTWNRAPSSEIAIWNCGTALLAANTATTKPIDLSIYIGNGGGTLNTVMAMNAAAGWLFDGLDPQRKSQWDRIMVGVESSIAPSMVFADLPSGSGDTNPNGPIEGQEYTVINAFGTGTFAGPITSGGGAGRWKLRYVAGSVNKWTRVG